MGWITIKEKIEAFIKKYKYIILVVLIGIVLMNIPAKHDADAETNLPIQEQNPTIITTEEEHRLQTILSKINGVGEVEVMLTLASGQQTVYQVDNDLSENSGGITQKHQTVIITDSTRANTGLVSRIDAPKYMGAVIVCRGGDDPIVRLAIVDAVTKALGLSSDKISVLKMK